MHSKLKFMVRNRSSSRTTKGKGKGKGERETAPRSYALCGLLFLRGSRVDMQFAYETGKRYREVEGARRGGRRSRA